MWLSLSCGYRINAGHTLTELSKYQFNVRISVLRGMKQRKEIHDYCNLKHLEYFLDYSHLILPFKFLLCSQIFLLCAGAISAHTKACIPCAILELSGTTPESELSGTIPESADKVGIPTLRRIIPELSRFLHCAEQIYLSHCQARIALSVAYMTGKQEVACSIPDSGSILSKD